MKDKQETHQKDGRDLIREMLLRLQADTSRKVKDFRKDQEQESDTEPEDEMDLARTSAEVETHAGLIARAEEKLRFLDEALTRLNAGQYGKCLGCGGAIPIERLMAIPFASYCVDCQEERNRARAGWGEGTVIQPYDHQWTVPEEMQEPTEREARRTDPDERLTIDTYGQIGPGRPRHRATTGAQAPKKRAPPKK